MTQRKPPAEASHVDRQLWRACAGALVHPPTLNSQVYYFPQGHMEQSSTPITSLPITLTSHPMILCRVSSLQLLADPHTDEVFAKLRLVPIHNANDIFNVDGQGDGDGDGGVESYAKVLTSSDANNGGGFSVPRFCADSVFPKLDYNVEPPLQTLVVKDLHGEVWKFRHIYRGTPRRHLLTTGWSRFVNSKKLIGGDSVVFMKDGRGGVSVGIRRVARTNVSGEFAKWRDQIRGGGFFGEVEEVGETDDGWAGFGSGKVSAESVVRAIELAMQGSEFEVLYYPKAPWSDFVVKTEVVEESKKIGWVPGLRVRISIETEDLSRLNWLPGTVHATFIPDTLPWFGSPWRMLQVCWDEPEATHQPSRVNPWQVEIIGPVPSLTDHTLPPSKKPRLSQSSPGGEADFFSPMWESNNSEMNLSIPPLSDMNSFPFGMQVARHSSILQSSLPNTISHGTPNGCLDNSLGKDMVPKPGSLSTELNIGSSDSGDLSTSSQNSVQSTAEKNSGKREGSTKVCANWFQLFGQIIHYDRIQSPSTDVGHTEGEVAIKHAENGDSDITVHLSLTSPLTDRTNSSGVRDS